MKKKQVPALMLSLALLGGCTATPAPTENGDGGKAGDLAYQCAGLTQDFPLATVDGVTVEAGKYLFWLATAIQVRQSYYGLPETEEEWAEINDTLKEDALETMILYQVVENKAAELGVTLDEEIYTQLDQDLASYIEELGGEEEYQAYLDSYCTTAETLYWMNEVYYLNQGILEKLTEDGTLAVTQEDIDKTVLEIVEQNEYYAAKHILIATRRVTEDGSGYEEYSDEEKQAAYEKALNLRENLLEANDSEELFDELMNEFSEDGRDPDTGELYAAAGYNLVSPGYMVEEFENAAMALEIGQVSDVVTSDFGYHIIMRIPLDTTEIEGYVEENLTESYHLSLLTQEWVDAAAVVTDPAYDSIDVYAFYTNLVEQNELLHPVTDEEG